MPLTVYQIQRTDLALLDLQKLLRTAESTFYKNENKRICAFTLADPTGPDQGHNVVAIDDAATEPGPLMLKSYDAALEEIELATQLAQLEQQGTLRVRCYDVVLVEGKSAYVAVCDPVSPASPPLASPNMLTVQGKMSTFGGQKDTGMGFAENLAWIEDEPEAAPYPGYFVAGLPGEGYGRRLDAGSATDLYLACRWDYNVTPKHFLAQPTTVCTVVNPANGKTARARPIDWGPSDSKPGAKDRVADLSPALADALGLTTDQVCVVQTPTPGNVPAPVALPPPSVGAAGQRRVVMLTGDYVGKHVRQAQAKAAGCALSIEFHFNSNGSDAKHSGVYYKHQDPRSEAAAKLLQDGFDQLFADKPGWGGSAKDSSDDGGRSAFIDRYGQPAVLIEPLFVSNPDQAAWIHDDANVGLLARVVADALIAATADGDLIGLSIGHLGKDSSPGDRGAPCCQGDTEATHGSKLALAVCQLLCA